MKKIIKGKFQWLQQMIIKRWKINQIKIQMLSVEILINSNYFLQTCCKFLLIHLILFNYLYIKENIIYI